MKKFLVNLFANHFTKIKENREKKKKEHGIKQKQRMRELAESLEFEEDYRSGAMIFMLNTHNLLVLHEGMKDFAGFIFTVFNDIGEQILTIPVDSEYVPLLVKHFNDPLDRIMWEKDATTWHWDYLEATTGFKRSRKYKDPYTLFN